MNKTVHVACGVEGRAVHRKHLKPPICSLTHPATFSIPHMHAAAITCPPPVI